MRIPNLLFSLGLCLFLYSCTEPYEPIDDAEVVVRLPVEPAKLSALYAAGRVDDVRVSSKIYQTLLEYDPETLDIVPVAAVSRPTITPIESGKYSGGARQEYTLRKDAKWSDGKPVTAADFIMTIKAIIAPQFGLTYKYLLEFVKEINVDSTDPYKFTVLTDSKYILSEISLGNMPILPKHIHDPDGLLDKYSLSDIRSSDFGAGADSTALVELGEINGGDVFNRDATKLVGSGAYELESWTSGSQIVLKRKENWWGNDIQEENNVLESKPRKISYRFVKDEPAAITMLKDGQLDAMTSINPTSFVQLRDNELATSELNLSTPPFLQYYFMGMNLENPKLDDVRVRKALAHLVDYNRLIDNVLYGMGSRTVGPLHPNNKAYNHNLELPDYNIEKAITLLESAGWTDTNGNGTRDKMINGKLTELELTALATPSENSKNIGLFMKETVSQAGIVFNLDQRDHKSWLPNEVIPGKYDLFMLAWSQPLDYDPMALWHTSSIKGGRNWVRYGTTETDKVIDELRNELDHEKRLKLYHQWQQDVVAAQPYIFLCAPTERIAVNKKFDAVVSVRSPGLFENLITTRDQIGSQ